MIPETNHIVNERPSLGGYIAGIYLFSVPILSYSEELGLFKVPQYIGFVLVLYTVYDLFMNRRFTRSKFALFYLLFTLFGAITFFYSEHRDETEAIFTLIKVMIITVSITQLIKNRADYLLSLYIFFLSIFIALYLNYDEILRMRNSVTLSEEERFAGSFANANTAALYCLAIFWVGFNWLFSTDRKLLLKIIIIPGLILALMVTLYSGSRKGIIGLGFISIGIAWIAVNRFGTSYIRRILMGLILFIVLMLLFRFLVNSPFFYRLQGMFEGESSSNARSDLFRQAITIWSQSIKNLIMGIGINNFKFHNGYFAYSHSTISETLVSTGIIGFFLYFMGFYKSLIAYYKLFRRQIKTYRISILMNLFMLLMILFFNSTAVMFDDRLFMPLLGIISAYILILEKTILEEEDKENAEEETESLLSPIN